MSRKQGTPLGMRPAVSAFGHRIDGKSMTYCGNEAAA
jgi:hypothetical protein